MTSKIKENPSLLLRPPKENRAAAPAARGPMARAASGAGTGLGRASVTLAGVAPSKRGTPYVSTRSAPISFHSRSIA